MNIYLQRLENAILAGIQGMSEEESTHRMGEKWNPAEILEHLLLSYTATVKGLERCLDGNQTTKVRTLQDRLATILVVQLGYFPNGRKAPERTLPKGMKVEAVISEIPENIRKMDQLFTACDQMFGRGSAVMDHPSLGPLTAQQWRKFHLIHGEHHVKQIVRMRKIQPVAG